MHKLLSLLLIFTNILFSSEKSYMVHDSLPKADLFALEQEFSSLLNFVHVIEWRIEGDEHPKIFNNNGNALQRQKDLKIVALYKNQGLVLYEELKKISGPAIGAPKYCLHLKVRNGSYFF